MAALLLKAGFALTVLGANEKAQQAFVDQIFASGECFARGQNNRRQLPQVDSLIDFVDQLASMGEDPTERADEVAPDHAPVVASFDL
jgi:hypothetical protein